MRSSGSLSLWERGRLVPSIPQTDAHARRKRGPHASPSRGVNGLTSDPCQLKGSSAAGHLLGEILSLICLPASPQMPTMAVALAAPGRG